MTLALIFYLKVERTGFPYRMSMRRMHHDHDRPIYDGEYQQTHITSRSQYWALARRLLSSFASTDIERGLAIR